MLLCPHGAPITVMDFSKIYERESFYRKENIQWLDCTDIAGKNCFCTPTAKNQIKTRMKHCSPYGIHFIDSGNFHYVTQFWTDKLEQNFVLIVLDHHSDMQSSLFGNLLTCGSWILDVIDQNRFLQKVVLLGIAKEQAAHIPKAYRSQLVCIDQKEIHTNSFWEAMNHLQEKYPLYLSLDKDVLSEKVLNTNWSQGDMQLNELKKILHNLITHQTVLGMDVCGECEETVEMLSKIRENDAFNHQLLAFIKQEKAVIV